MTVSRTSLNTFAARRVVPLVGLCLGGATLLAQELPARPAPPPIAAGQLLIATRKSRDPDLKGTAILIAQMDDQGVIGLVLNRPSEVRIARLFPRLEKAQSARPQPGKTQTPKTGNASEFVFTGGPLNIGVRGLLESRFHPEGAIHVAADVYMVSSAALLEKALASAPPASSFRVYAGYAGWTAEQLKHEIMLGWWDVLPWDSTAVFDRNPGGVWPRLSKPH